MARSSPIGRFGVPAAGAAPSARKLQHVGELLGVARRVGDEIVRCAGQGVYSSRRATVGSSAAALTRGPEAARPCAA